MELHAGHHMVVQLLGLNVNLDTLMMTWLVAALVIIVTVAANTDCRQCNGKCLP